VGSYVRQESVTTREAAGARTSTVATSTQTLTMATEEKLVLTVVTDVNGRRSTDRTEVPRADDTPMNIAKLGAGQSASGEETVEISGRPVRCRWVEHRGKTTDVDYVRRLYFSDELPGGLVKLEHWLDGPGAKIYTNTRVIDFRVP
jgi:hypothetical protein